MVEHKGLGAGVRGGQRPSSRGVYRGLGIRGRPSFSPVFFLFLFCFLGLFLPSLASCFLVLDLSAPWVNVWRGLEGRYISFHNVPNTHTHSPVIVLHDTTTTTTFSMEMTPLSHGGRWNDVQRTAMSSCSAG